MRYTNRDKIRHCYDKTGEHPKGKIPKPRTQGSWEKHKPLKEYIKFHHSVVQDDICSYCRLPIKYGGYGEPIEHIVPKKLNSFWMFHPSNLCLACFGCNTNKSDANTLVNNIDTYSKRYEDYKMDYREYKIVHPHFDTFSDYIEIDGFIYKQRAFSRHNKGNNTIEMCKLNRLDVMYERARQKSNSKRNIYQIALKVISNGNSTTKEVEAAQKLVDDLLKRFSYQRKLSTR